MQVSAAIFKAYDIRGVVPATLNEAVAEALGKAFGTRALAEGQQAVAVGRDGRLSGPALSAALIRGLVAAGVRVVDVGLCTTPMLYFAANTACQSGIQVTGSHNPKDYNGFKMVLAGRAIYGEEIQALRRTMELCAATTRFALACNTSSRVIEPVQSRCALLRYGRLPDAALAERLVRVARAEALRYTPAGIEALVFAAEGDLRHAINSLQATAAVSGGGGGVGAEGTSTTGSTGSTGSSTGTGTGTNTPSSATNTPSSAINTPSSANNTHPSAINTGCITPENVYRVCDQPHPALIGGIIEFCLRADPDAALVLLEQLCAKGYAPVDLVTTFFRVLRSFPNQRLTDALQLEFIKRVGDTHVRILEGAPSRLQLAALVCQLARCAMSDRDFTVSL